MTGRPEFISPPVVDEDGKNLDPRKCDCGKGDACPLWSDEWRAFYAEADAAVAFVQESGGFENAVRRLLS